MNKFDKVKFDKVKSNINSDFALIEMPEEIDMPTFNYILDYFDGDIDQTALFAMHPNYGAFEYSQVMVIARKKKYNKNYHKVRQNNENILRGV